jgi:hypothetical protein
MLRPFADELREARLDRWLERIGQALDEVSSLPVSEEFQPTGIWLRPPDA